MAFQCQQKNGISWQKCLNNSSIYVHHIYTGLLIVCFTVLLIQPDYSHYTQSWIYKVLF